MLRYSVLLDGAAGPDVQLDKPPTPDEILKIPGGGGKVRVLAVLPGGDGAGVIQATRELTRPSGDQPRPVGW